MKQCRALTDIAQDLLKSDEKHIFIQELLLWSPKAYGKQHKLKAFEITILEKQRSDLLNLYYKYV